MFWGLNNCLHHLYVPACRVYLGDYNLPVCTDSTCLFMYVLREQAVGDYAHLHLVGIFCRVVAGCCQGVVTDCCHVGLTYYFWFTHVSLVHFDF